MSYLALNTPARRVREDAQKPSDRASPDDHPEDLGTSLIKNRHYISQGIHRKPYGNAWLPYLPQTKERTSSSTHPFCESSCSYYVPYEIEVGL